jgi:hypothetical protein
VHVIARRLFVGFIYTIAFHLGWPPGCSGPFFIFHLLLSPSLASSLSVMHSGPLPSYPVPTVPNTCILASISCQTANCLDRGIILDGDNINEGHLVLRSYAICLHAFVGAAEAGLLVSCRGVDLRAVRVFSGARRCRTSPSRHYSPYAPYLIPSHLTPGPRLRMSMSRRHGRSRRLRDWGSWWQR